MQSITSSFKNTLVLLMKLGILLVSVAGFLLVYISYYYVENSFYFKGDALFLCVYALLLYFFLHTYNAFKLGASRYRDLVFAYGIGTFFTNLIAYFLLSLFALKLLSPWPLAIVTVALWALFAPVYQLMQKAYGALFPALSALAVCADAYDLSTIGKFTRDNTRFVVRDTCSEDIGVDGLLEKAASHAALILGHVSLDTRERLLAYGYLAGKQVILLPSLPDILSNSASPLIINDSLVYICKTPELSLDTRILKRAMDIAAAGLLLIVASPLMLLAAIAVKAYDRKPALLKQTRLTRGGRPFTLYKFRSMVVDAEKESGARLSSGKDDARITPVGRFLRASHIDELPQLINVLKGDMSMVGPRPERPEMYERICESFPEFRYRLAVKAGVTGYAQLYGRYDTSFEDKARLDVYYIENETFLLDLQLLIYTLKDMFIKNEDGAAKREARSRAGAEGGK